MRNGIRFPFLCVTFSLLLFAQAASAQADVRSEIKLGEWYGPVKSQETLWSIARRAAALDKRIGIWDMVDAIYASNPSAFVGTSDQLKKGARLKIPDIGEKSEWMVQEPIQAEHYEDSEVYALYDEQIVEVVPLDEFIQSNRVVEQPVAEIFSETTLEAFKSRAEYVAVRDLLGQRQTEEAFLLLSPLEEDFAGDPDFDYLLGISALDSGRPGNAVFALQRLMATKPNYPAARFELARAYFELGDDRAAKKEFEGVLASNPPEKVRQLATTYLSALERRSGKFEEITIRRVTTEAGYDSNANSGTSAESIQVGGIVFDLDADARNNESSYWGVQGAVSYSNPIKPRLRWQSSSNFSHRQYPSAHFVSSTRAQIGTGLQWSKESLTLGASVSAYYGLIESDFNHAGAAIDLNFGNLLYNTWLFNSTLRLGTVQFDDSVDAQDVDQVLGAISLAKAHDLFRGGLVSMALVGGRDYERNNGSPNGREIIGGRLLGSARLTPMITANLGGTILGSHYDGRFFGEIRNDVQFSTVFDLVMTHASYPDWSLRPYVQYVRSQSEIAVFDYSRVDTGISLTKEMR